MIIIVLTNCPHALRGDLTKWLFEISTNVFVGRVSARVRDLLWKRVEQHCGSGRATMVFNTNNEQHFDFRVHNSEWEPIDIDGFKLMLRPNFIDADGTGLKVGYSKASRYLAAKRKTSIKKQSVDSPSIVTPMEGGTPQMYTVIDVETTGLSVEKDAIIRLNALRISGDRIIDSISIRVEPHTLKLPSNKELTRMTEKLREDGGENLPTAMGKFLSFVSDSVIVAHNIRFNMGFIIAACDTCGLTTPTNKTEDVEAIAKKTLYNLRNHSLNSLSEYFGITSGQASFFDRCYVIMKIHKELQNKGC